MNVAGDVTGDVFSLDIEGTSGTVNHAVTSTDPNYDGLVADGISLSVARPGQGTVVIKESGGFTALYEGGCFNLAPTSALCGSIPPLPSIDSYTVELAAQPVCGSGITGASCKVYVTVSAAYPPQSEHRLVTLGTIPDGLPVGTDGETFLVSTLAGAPADFLRQITLNGFLVDVSKRSLVLVFDALNWATPQTVFTFAVDDTRAEGNRIITASHTVIQPSCSPADPTHCYDGAIVRNVEATVYDNDQPDIIVVQLDPNTLHLDNNTVVLEGFGTGSGQAITEQLDRYSVQLASAPAAGKVVSVQIAPSDSRVCLDSADGRFSSSVGGCPSTGTTYFAQFNEFNWYQPLIVAIHARNDFAVEDPHNTVLLHTIVNIAGHATTDTAYNTAAPTVREHVDVLVLDDESPGVFTLESDGKTLVVACGNPTCTAPGDGDSYLLRLTSAPFANVKIAIVTDGQTDVDLSSVDPSRIALEAIGHIDSTQSFLGNITIAAGGPTATFTRANGSELGSFLDEGFVIGQRIRLGGAGAPNGDYVIVDLTALTLTVKPASALPGGTPGAASAGTFANVTLSQLRERGVFAGGVTWNQAANTLVRTDGSSWLDSGFLEGQLIKIDGFAGMFKIQLIDGTGAGKTDRATLTGHPTALPASGTANLTITQWAAVASFTPPDPGNAPQTCPVATCGNWYQGLVIPLLADPFFQISAERATLRVFPKQAHLLSGIQGPLAVEGGTTSADRSLHAAVLLPGEGNGPVFRVAPQPPEWQAIDTLNVYGDGARSDLSGKLTSTALTGLGMGQSLDFSYLLCTDVNDRSTCKHPFNEPGIYPGGISYGSISLDANGNFSTDGNLSTVEVVNIMLGSGNDHLDIDSTLQPGGDFNPITGQRGELAHHGGVTAIHGGGNAPLMVNGSFDLAPGTIARRDGLAWSSFGFAVGQQITIPGGGSYTIIGFATGAYGPGDTLLVDGGATLPTATVNGLVSVSDHLQTTGSFVLSGNRVTLTNGQSWQALGFAYGQQVYVTGVGVRTVVGFDNDATYGDGSALLLSGATLGAAHTVAGTVSVTSRFRVTGTLALAGTATGGTVTVASIAGSGFAAGQQVAISGVNGLRTIVAISGNTLTLTGGALPTSVLAGTLSVVRIGGDTITLTGASTAATVNVTTSTLSRTDGGSWITDGFTAGRQVILTGGLAGTFNVTNVTATTLTLTGVNGSTLTAATGVAAKVTVLPVGAGPGQPYDGYAPLVIYGDTSQDGVWYGGDPHTLSLHNFGPKPMPHLENVTVSLSTTADGKTATITRNTGASPGSFLADGFAVGQELALGPISPAATQTGAVDVFSNRLVLRTGTWSGFAIGQQITISGLSGTWTVIGIAGNTLQLNGATLAPLPNQTLTVSAVSAYVGVVKGVTATTITLNLAITIADHPEGPHFPPNAANVVRNLVVLNRVGNSAPFFVFPLANPFTYSGNDVIDAHLLDWSDAPGALRNVGLTIFGGAGDDTIIGSQAGDHLAGGSGNDTILGQRGEDHIYGDSGFNVNLITRELSVATTSAGPSGYPAAQFKNRDLLLAGNDLLYGEGPGSAPSLATSGIGQDDDVIFGDLGVVTQDVSGARDTTKTVPSKPQKLQTTLFAAHSSSTGLVKIESKALQNGGNDWIYGNVDRDVLIGGTGDDAIDGGEQDDLIFGDNAVVVRTLGDTTSPRFQTLTGTLMYSRSDLTPGATADNSGVLLVDGTPRAYRDPDDVPWWAEYDVTDLWQTLDADLGVAWAGSFGNDYIAGNKANDVIFGQLGNDTIQGDGSIDYVAHRLLDDGTVDPAYNAALRGRVAAFRTPGGATDPIGPLTLYPSYEATTDGEDYVEGNGGNDLIFGGLGQDDLVGGSSNFFSLVGRLQRPDGSDTIFGGAGNRTLRDEDSHFASTGLDHARDADTISGDNADIVRIVGTNHVDVGATQRYVRFVYDDYDPSAGYDANTHLVVRGTTLLDYTPGGPDFRPDLFGLAANSNGSLSLAVAAGRNVWTVDIGGNDELHGGMGDDTIYGAVGNDVLYGDAQDDDLYGNWGSDWISGGTGQDGVLGDDGRIFTSRNGSIGEALYGVAALLATDPDDRLSNGNVVDEFIYTPGEHQTATINRRGALNKAVDLSPFDLTPDQFGTNPLYDANNSDDVIFGGWDDDFLHGGAGDDMVSGSEALVESYVQLYDGSTTCEQHFNCAVGLVRTDWYHPWNPSDILVFGSDTDVRHANRHIQPRLGEFLLYDEYDPRRAIVFNADGSVWQCQAFSNSGHTCTDTGGTPPSRQYFLNFDQNDGRTTALGCVELAPNGTCLRSETRKSDGGDAIFGDYGNDWLVGGTGNDTLWGGWGNDLSNADDDLTTNGALNDTTDTHPSYEDRVYGGAGLDILIANTGGDRLIDWVGEFNSYLVPFAPFGISTVSRQVPPWLFEFLYALSRSQGADPTRAEDNPDLAPRNGEPYGEIGLVTQKDHGLWQQQTGMPTDPQPGNIPGGRRDVLRSADFSNGNGSHNATVFGFAPDSGKWDVSGGILSVSADSLGAEAAAVFYVDQYIPTYYEISAQVMTQAPTGGWKANAYVIFDYFSPTDFKFAGIDASINKAVVGHRTAAGWIVDQQTSVPGSVRSNTWYDLLVVVNGLVVTVSINGSQRLTFQYDPRYIDGKAYGLNMGYVGVGSDNSRGSFDNVTVQALPPQASFTDTETYDDGAAPLFTSPTGTWAISSGRYNGNASSNAAVNVINPGLTVTPDAYTELETLVKPTGVAGLVFDRYSDDDYKFVTLDPSTGALTIGHRVRKKDVNDQVTTVAIPAGADQRLQISLKGLTVTVLLNGVQVATYSFNGDVVDGGMGLLVRSGSASFDATRILIGTQVINAVDAVAPLLTIPANVTRSNDPGKGTAYVSDASLGNATATDNVPGVTVSRVGVPAGNLFPIGVTTIPWTALDVFGNTTVKTQTVTVNDVERPTLTIPANVSLTTTGTTLALTSAQLGSATASDNSGSVTLTRSGVPAGNVFGVGTTTITYTATDAAGNATTLTQTVTITYAGPPLSYTAPGNQSSTEGANVTFNLGSFANGAGGWKVTVNWGDGTTSTLNPTATGSIASPHSYANDRTTPYTVTVTLTDASGATRTGSFTVAVSNVAPTITAVTPASGTVVSNRSSFTVLTTFTDPGTADTHTCTIAWGDGTTSTGTVSGSGPKTCAAAKSYSVNGTYTVTVTVTDSSGAFARTTLTIVVTQNGKPPSPLAPVTLAATAKASAAAPAAKPAKAHAPKAKKKAPGRALPLQRTTRAL
jgi:Ca2+-binding RTX toxin-like protein